MVVIIHKRIYYHLNFEWLSKYVMCAFTHQKYCGNNLYVNKYKVLWNYLMKDFRTMCPSKSLWWPFWCWDKISSAIVYLRRFFIHTNVKDRIAIDSSQPSITIVTSPVCTISCPTNQLNPQTVATRCNQSRCGRYLWYFKQESFPYSSNTSSRHNNSMSFQLYFFALEKFHNF